MKGVIRLAFPGDPAIWLGMAVVALLLGPFLGYHLLRPTEHQTGSTTAPTTAALATIEKGQTACQEDIAIPDGSGRVQLHLTAPVAQPAPIEVWLESKTRVARGEIMPFVGLSDTRVKIAPVWRATGDGADLGRICIRAAREPLVLHGWPQRYPGDGPLTVDGREVAGHLSAIFVPPYPTFKSLLGLAPEVMERAALFRPAPLSAPLYWMLFFVGLPLSAYGGIRMMATRGAGRSAVALVFAVAFLNAGAWAVTTPAFNAPDEHVHFAYAEYLARTGSLPLKHGDRSPLSSAQVTAIDGQKTFAFHVYPTKPPWFALNEQQWQRATTGADFPADNGGGPSGATHYGPLYYASLVPAYWAGSGGGTFGELAAMRLWSALLGAIVAICALLTVRELLPRWPVLAVGAGLLVAFEPTFAFVSGSVNNDTGVNALAAAAVYLMTRMLCRGLSARRVIGLIAVAVALPATKTTGFALFPALLLGAGAVSIMWWRNSSFPTKTRALVLSCLIALGGVCTAIALNRGLLSTATGDSVSPGEYFSYLWQTFLPALPGMEEQVAQGWPAFEIYAKQGLAVFGWTTIALPTWVYQVAVVVAACLAACGIAALWRVRTRRVRVLQLIVLLLVPLSVVAGVAYAFAPGIRPVPVEQGRYLFPALVALVVLVAGSLTLLGRRWAGVVMAMLVTAMIGLAAASFSLALSVWYA